MTHDAPGGDGARSFTVPTARRIIIHCVLQTAMLIGGLALALDAIAAPAVAARVMAGVTIAMIVTVIVVARRSVQNEALSTPAERLAILFGAAVSWPVQLILAVQSLLSRRRWRTPRADGQTYRPPISDGDAADGVGTRTAHTLYAYTFTGLLMPIALFVIGLALELASRHSAAAAQTVAIVWAGLCAVLVLGARAGPQRALVGVTEHLGTVEPMTDDVVAAQLPDVDRAIIERTRAALGRAFNVPADVIRPDLDLTDDIPMVLYSSWVGAWLAAEVIPLRGRGIFVVPFRGRVADVMRLVQQYVRTR